MTCNIDNKFVKTNKLLDVTHSDETMYILNTNDFPVHDNEEDANMIKIMVNIWSTFIKNG